MKTFSYPCCYLKSNCQNNYLLFHIIVKFILVGAKLKVSGWGLISPKQFPKSLYRVTIPKVSRQECTKEWRVYYPKITIKKEHICAGTHSKGPCQVC
jgi:hypothetical protein